MWLKYGTVASLNQPKKSLKCPKAHSYEESSLKRYTYTYFLRPDCQGPKARTILNQKRRKGKGTKGFLLTRHKLQFNPEFFNHENNSHYILILNYNFASIQLITFSFMWDATLEHLWGDSSTSIFWPKQCRHQRSLFDTMCCIQLHEILPSTTCQSHPVLTHFLVITMCTINRNVASVKLLNVKSHYSIPLLLCKNDPV